MGRPRYRWRTSLRRALPGRPPLYRLVPKGRKDCGEHGWYNEDGIVEGCIYCRAHRPYDRWHFETRPLTDAERASFHAPAERAP